MIRAPRLRGPRSLLGQLVLLHVGIGLVAVAMLSLGVTAILHATAARYERELLARQAVLFARAIGPDGARRPAGAGDLLANGMAVALLDARRSVRGSLGPARPAIRAAAPLGPAPRFFRRGSVAGLSLPSPGGWIVVSQDAAAPEVVTDDIVRSFLTGFAMLLLPAVALVPVVGALLARRLTRRMRAVSAIAGRIGPRTLDVRIPAGLLPLEVEPLAAATNAALDRLADGFSIQAAFAADVAHELRTPLAAIRLRADAVPEADLRHALLASVDRAARVVSQLLVLADIERRVEDAGIGIDLRAMAAGIVAERAPGIVGGGRRIAFEAADARPIPVLGHGAPLSLALDNLIDNAARHTPPGTIITVTAGPGPRLGVADDGPGVPDAHLARLKDRFWRGGGNPEGRGIGLSIVERIAIAHGGTLEIARARAGGLACVIDLGGPAAD